MKQLFSLFICCLMATMSLAQEVYTVDNLPNVHLHDATRYVCNPANILTPAATDSIDSMLYALEQQTGIETVVAVLPTIGDADCYDFAFSLGNKWGVGKSKSDNGLVVLLVTDQRCIQMVTGYGLEGHLPDAICKRIQLNDMIPYLKNNQWNEGMVAGVRAICARLDGSKENEGTADEGEAIVALFAFLQSTVIVELFSTGNVVFWLSFMPISAQLSCDATYIFTYTVSSALAYIILPSLAGACIPVPVQHQKLSYFEPYTL